ncbi:odorant receptor 47a-like isoform X2 [Rhodnius prolixus]|uniref:odorant receptor 47a-like isoform X2 n=1 Tax=Rhodnius prolixus TaxID=13249 RepID=UPI003D18AD33
MVTLNADGVSPLRMVYSFHKLTDGMEEEGQLRFLLNLGTQLFICAYVTMVTGIELIWGHGNLYEIVNALSTFTVAINYLTKVVIILMYRREIRQLFARLEHLHMELLKDEDQRHIILDMERFSKMFLRFYKISLNFYPILSLITNFINDYKTDFRKIYLSLKLLTPWTISDIWSYSAGAMLILWISVMMLSSFFSFIAMELAFTFEITAFLKVLQGRLNNMNEKDENIYGLHRDIIKLVTDFNALFSGQMYWDILVSSIQPCGSGFILIKALKRKDPEATELFYKMILVVIGPFILCACGQQISTESEKLHEASYMIPWYEQTPRKRKNLIQMLTVTTKPSTINFKGIIVFNYSCFAAVAQGIYSYLMMVNKFATDD